MLDKWEVWSMKGPDDVNSGAEREASKMEGVKTKHQAQAKKKCSVLNDELGVQRSYFIH